MLKGTTPDDPHKGWGGRQTRPDPARPGQSQPDLARPGQTWLDLARPGSWV